MGDILSSLPVVPTRYEDIATGFRGRLRPNRDLIELVQKARRSCLIGSGIRFLPVFGRSGAGKTSAAMELSTHLANVVVDVLPHSTLVSREMLAARVLSIRAKHPDAFPVFVVDQYEEVVAERENIPSQFLEILSLLDRGELNKEPAFFIWLTTSEAFRSSLVSAARRNERLLMQESFDLVGPERAEWPAILHELFEFHNPGKQLADFQVLDGQLSSLSHDAPTIGHYSKKVVELLEPEVAPLHDLSDYMVVMLWPVTDMVGIQKVAQFTTPNTGYHIDWRAWLRQVGSDKNMAYEEMNKARLYFDMRLVPIQAADLHALMRDLSSESPVFARTHLDKFRMTHFFRLIANTWGEVNFKMMLERKESKRAKAAAVWYEQENNRQPVPVGKRLAKIVTACGYDAKHEQEVISASGKVRADVLVRRKDVAPKNVIVELKVFSPSTTMPSSIAEQIRVTMRRHAQLLGLLKG